VGALAALAAVGCKRSGDEGKGRGRSAASRASASASAPAKGQLLAPGVASDLRVTPDGQFLTYLLKAKKPAVDGIPPQMVVGELHVVPVAGGESQTLGTGVTNDVGGMLFTPGSKHLLFLTGFEPSVRSGALNVYTFATPTARSWPLWTAAC
jgi:hypothetical protein